MPYKKCETCGKEFKLKPSHMNRKFCSRTCGGKYQRKKVELTCERCGKVVLVKLSKAKEGQKYCSETCYKASRYGKYKVNLPIDEISAMYTEQGLSLTDIGDIFGATPTTVGKHLSRAGVKVRTIAQAHRMRVKRGIGVLQNHYNWKGGRYKTGGYIYVYQPDHLRASPKGYVREHILVWENSNGTLAKNMEVHHLNGVKTDNRIENLFAMTNTEHGKIHGKVPYKHKIKELEEQIKILQKQLGQRTD